MNKKILFFTIVICLIISCSAIVAAKQITGTANESYRKLLEEKYGFIIIIDDNIQQKESFYTAPAVVNDYELKVLKDIDSAFSILPEGFVKEVNDYYKSKGLNPSINVKLGKFTDGDEDVPGKFYSKDVSIYLVQKGNNFIINLLHELGHEIEWCLHEKKLSGELKDYFLEQTKGFEFQYNQNYKRMRNTNVETAQYYDYYVSDYASSTYEEDFAETFSLAVMQPRYFSNYGDGVVKPIHKKIKMLSFFICGQFKSVKDSDFLLRGAIDMPSESMKTVVKSAKDKNIIPWNTFGLNNFEMTRYDAALILQPLLYKYVEENELLKKANLKKDDPIPENFVLDLFDGEDVLLLNNLGIMQVDKGRFNPSGKIQMQSAAVILTKISQLFGLTDTNKTALKCADEAKIAETAKPSVQFVISMNIMKLDEKKNFNPEIFITYQEFYEALLNLCNLKDALNTKNKIAAPTTVYYQMLCVGTSLSKTGWLHYYDGGIFEKYTGKGRYINKNEGYDYQGDWANGKRTGKGAMIWKNGDIYEGDWKEGIKTGKGKFTLANGDIYEGDWVNDIKTGKGKFTWKNGNVYNGDWLNGKRTGKGVMNWANGDTYTGDWIEDIRTGKGKFTWKNGESYDGDWVNDKKHGKGTYKFKSGDVYTGDWVNDQRTGKGRYTWADGTFVEGTFEKGVFIK